MAEDPGRLSTPAVAVPSTVWYGTVTVDPEGTDSEITKPMLVEPSSHS